jgi:uncharacterized membrane protein YhaH (DUF805 family)
MIEPSKASAGSIWSYEGRSSRTDYFVVLLSTSVLGAIAGTIMVKGGALGFFSGLFFAAVLWISMCASARRLHDVGHSGWWSLITLVPGANFLLGLYVLFAPGQDGDNEFGQSLLSSSAPVPRTLPLPAAGTQGQIQHPVSAQVTAKVEVISQVLSATGSAETEPMEDFWAQALHECESSTMKAGLWAKALAEAAGDEKLAKATYIRLRATQLQVQYAQNQQALQLVRDQERQLEQERLAAQEAAAAALLAQMNEDERAKAMLPKGRCPACEAVIPLESETCPHCDALFTEDSKWKVKPLNRYEAIAQKAGDNSTVYSLRTKEEKESENASQLIFLGILLLLLGLAVANA